MRSIIERKRIEQLAHALGVDPLRLGLPRPNLLELAQERFERAIEIFSARVPVADRFASWRNLH